MAPKGKAKGKAAKDDATADAKASGKVKGAQSVNVRHILCEKQSKSNEALEKLKEGAKFDEVAREFSEDKARAGGSLGWKGKGALDPEFEKIAFELESSTTANPTYRVVKTQFGYHIVMVEGRK